MLESTSSVKMSSVCAFCRCGGEGNFDSLTGPFFRISCSSLRVCGWNLPEAWRYAEVTQIVLVQCLRLSWFHPAHMLYWSHHWCQTGPNEEQLSPHSGSRADTQRSPGGLLSMCSKTGSRCLFFWARSVCAVITPVMLWLIQPSERGWVGDAALTVCSEQTHLGDLCLCAVW